MEDHDSPACNQPTVRKGRSGPITDRIARWGSTLNWCIIGLLVPSLCYGEDVELAFLKCMRNVLGGSHFFFEANAALLSITASFHSVIFSDLYSGLKAYC